MTDADKKIFFDGIRATEKTIADITGKTLDSDKLFNILEVCFQQINYYNPIYKLVKADERELVVKHFLDSIAPAGLIYRLLEPKFVNAADLGSGAGFPGLVLSAVFSCFKNSEKNVRLNLVERMGRRAGFLRTCSVLSGLTDYVSVVEKDLSEINEVYNLVVMRAFRPLSEIYRDLLRITERGSKVVIYKAGIKGITDEISFVNLSDFSTRVESYKVPFLNADRSLLILTRKN